jgi:tRNA threonylcarbamoyladenosine biosynthesis protein TsaB
VNRTLGLDCSSTEMGLGLCENGVPVSAFSRYAAGSHAEHIARGLELLLAANDVPAETITRIGVAVGPGSFTGLRIALAFVKGFTLELPIRILPISSLHALAAAWLPTGRRGIAVAFDARRGEVFWARFERRETALVRAHDDTLSPRDDFVRELRDDDDVVTDTLGFARSEVFEDLPGHAQVYSVDQHAVQRGLSCARLAAAEPEDSPAWVCAHDLLPTYLRPPYAEERRRTTSSEAPKR